MIQLDEINGKTLENGLDTNVIVKKIKATVGIGSIIFQIFIFVIGFVPGIIMLFINDVELHQKIIVLVLGCIPAIVLLVKKTNAKNYFQQLQQKMQHDRSTIDNYIEQRVIVLENCVRLVEKSINLDKETYIKIAEARSNKELNEKQDSVDAAYNSLNIVLENYPNLESHSQIKEAMRQNILLQREITAARDQYNDRVNMWNRDIFEWPIKNIVAAKMKLETIIPFATSQEMKNRARKAIF